MIGYLGCLFIAGFFLLVGLVWGKIIGRKRARQERVIFAEEALIELRRENVLLAKEVKETDDLYEQQMKVYKRGLEERLQVSEEMVADSLVPLITVPRHELKQLQLIREKWFKRVDRLEKTISELRAENAKLRKKLAPSMKTTRKGGG